MSLPGLFDATPANVRRWVAGERHLGIYFKRPSGVSRCIVPTGRKVVSMCGKRGEEKEQWDFSQR
jgi:hypothetical protein